MEYFVILPHQLFEKRYLDKKYIYILWEHPHYFTDYKYNQKRIILHRGSMKYYKDYLTKSGFKTKYYSYKQSLPKTIKSYYYFDPIDKIKMPTNGTMIESPNFILDKETYAKYRQKTQSVIFNNFYMWSKKEVNIIPSIKSQDKHNRKKMPAKTKIPLMPNNKTDSKYIKLGINYVKNNFSKNYGNTKNFIFPLTHKTAKKWLSHFIKHKIKNFGNYQDSIVKNEQFLFHSVLSSSINIGLLNPSDIINAIMKNKSKIPLNSLEGYIRQLFWREYQRYCYIYVNFKRNYFGNKKKLTKNWYTGSTGIEPVDDCIKNAFDTGYLHHIERLMIIGNYMNLSEISPKEGYKWFMEFSCDSYDWVMSQNVLDMVFFVTGGVTMRRPYASSSNYVIKMSNYKKGEWSDIWDELYKKFMKRNKKKLWKFRYYFPGLKKL
jgi:deoxyribodipyrimidine photolyase-related protein